MWQPWTASKGDWVGGMTLELADNLLLATVDNVNLGTSYDIAPVDGLAVVNLTGSYAVHEGVGVAITAPLWLGHTEDLSALGEGVEGYGGSLNTARLWVPVALVDEAERGFGLSVVPFLDVGWGLNDTKTQYRSPGSGLGFLMAVGLSGGPLRLSANLGAEVHPNNLIYQVAGDPSSGVALNHQLQGLASGALVYQTKGALALHLEGNIAPSPGSQAAAPAEVLLMGSRPINERWRAWAGASSALTPAPSAATWRAFVGVSAAHRAPPPGPVVEAAPVYGPDHLLVTVVDAQGAPVNANLSVLGRDTLTNVPAGDDGAEPLLLGPGQAVLVAEAPGFGRQLREINLDPEALSPERLELVLHPATGGEVLEVRVVDAQDRAVTDGRIVVGAFDLGDLGSGGWARVEGLPVEAQPLMVTAPDFAPAEADAKLNTPQQLVMDRLQGSVRVTVRSAEGPASDVLVRVLGPELMAPLRLDADGQQTFQLAPGEWTLAASSPRFGLQERGLVMPADFSGLMEVEIVLLEAAAAPTSLSVRLVDPEGAPVEGVEVMLDGQRIGTSGSGGRLKVEGLPQGEHQVTVQDPRLRPMEPISITLGPQGKELLVPLAYLPGSLRVMARRGDAPVPDARIRFSGPSTLPSSALGADGEGYFTLDPGQWVVALSAESLGVQEREVLVEADETSLLVIDAVLAPSEEGAAKLTVRVNGPDGAPLGDIGVSLDGQSLGRTSSGGSLTIEGLDPGARLLRLDGGELYTEAELKLKLKAGDNRAESKLSYEPGAVTVRAAAESGAVIDALVRFFGPENLPPSSLGADGERTFHLETGEWVVVASSPAYGVEEEDLTVKPGKNNNVKLNFTLTAAEASAPLEELAPRPVTVQVKRVDGGPLVASVRAVGPERVEPQVTAIDGQLVLSLRPGTWEIIATAAELGTARKTLTLTPKQADATLVFELGERKVEVNTDSVKILEQVFFDLDKSTIRPESFALLDQVANTLLLNPQLRRVEIQGHTDSQGTAEYNLALSQARAEAVRAYLIQRGVAEYRLVAVGYGLSQPLTQETSESKRALNRRVQFVILEQGAAKAEPEAPAPTPAP
ncbi:MAG: OmpA family protein [Deltaproteobacteria bacterium]|nr:OmpA family protein [Deltaproteobacteria bacterium]